MQTPLSVLDLAPVPDGSDAGSALRDTVALAQAVERRGYRRIWVAEHHNMPGIASSAPAVLIAHLAAATDTIRVGSGGVMLPNHPPLVVAEQFGMLEALHPGRVDLGLGRAPGTDQATAAALRRSASALSADDFPQQLAELRAFLTDGFPEGHPYRRIAAVPKGAGTPDIWLLGSSGYSAQLAGLLGLPFAFAHHFSAENTLPAMALYRRSFRPSEVLAEPYGMVCVQVIAADTDEQARYLAGSAALSFLRLRQGRPGPLPHPDEAARYPYQPHELTMARSRLAEQAVGTPQAVVERLSELVRQAGAQELMLTTLVHDPAARLRSFELVADAWGLPALRR